MGDYEKSMPVDVPPAELFGYLSDVTNLPAYLPRLTSVTPLGGDKVEVTAHIDPPGQPEQDVAGEAWVSVKQQGRTLQWGSAGPHDYRGELDVDPGKDEHSSTLTVRLHTEQVEGDHLEDSLAETLIGVKNAAERAYTG